MKGFSGSPVFLQNTKSKKWRYCGILIQGLYDLSAAVPGGLILVKPDIILKELNQIQKR
jgi:hypothetical protein